MDKLPVFKLEEYFAEWEFKARYLMSSSDVETLAVADLLKLADDSDRESFYSLRLGYTETRGNPELLEEIARLYRQMSSENIFTTAGAEEAIYAFFASCINPGDEVVVFTPAYQSLKDVPRFFGAEVIEIPLIEERGWKPDLELLGRSIGRKTKCVVMNFPNNPTGSLLDAEEFNFIVERAGRFGSYIFSDEVYRLLEIDERKRLPAVCDVYDRGVSLSVMSKAFGLGGLRIGWLASQDKEALKRVAEVKHYLSICNSGPSEQLALIALRSKDKILERSMRLLLANLTKLKGFMEKHHRFFSWQEPQGGCIALPRLLQGDSDEFCKNVIAKTGVLLLPGSVYGTSGSYMRMGFGRANFVEALSRFETYLDTL